MPGLPCEVSVLDRYYRNAVSTVQRVMEKREMKFKDYFFLRKDQIPRLGYATLALHNASVPPAGGRAHALAGSSIVLLLILLLLFIAASGRSFKSGSSLNRVRFHITLGGIAALTTLVYLANSETGFLIFRSEP